MSDERRCTFKAEDDAHTPKTRAVTWLRLLGVVVTGLLFSVILRQFDLKPPGFAFLSAT